MGQIVQFELDFPFSGQAVHVTFITNIFNNQQNNKKQY